ncbi:MAG: HAMP domain-containing protein [Rhodospirillales bacterium]|nr:HAMP domain-containing protein [Rhodospirillales bacterium]
MIRRLWPSTLVGRTALVLLLGVALSNAIGLLVYSGDRLNVLTTSRGLDLAERIASVVPLFERALPRERQALARSLRRPGVRLAWTKWPIADGDSSSLSAGLIRRALLKELGAEWENRLLLAYQTEDGRRRRFGGHGDRGPSSRGGFAGRNSQAGQQGDVVRSEERRARLEPEVEREVLVGSLRLNDGSWLNFIAPAAVFKPFWATRFFVIGIATTVVIALFSLWAVRVAARPLSMFAVAAERLGRDVDAPALSETGPAEVRQAAVAFNQMQTRLQALLRDRLQMLAGLSHDLRTPITRLKLRAELIDDSQQQEKFLADLEEIRSMVEASLAFARDEAGQEPEIPIDIAVLLQTVCDELVDSGGDASYAGPSHVSYRGRPTTLKRAFTNLVENAIKYGGVARIDLEEKAQHIVITVDDDGPGIPDSEIDKVFEPFYRIDGSRSRDTGGVGLGLAVVLSAIRLHGGHVLLSNREGGGLRATVELPL